MKITKINNSACNISIVDINLKFEFLRIDIDTCDMLEKSLFIFGPHNITFTYNNNVYTANVNTKDYFSRLMELEISNLKIISLEESNTKINTIKDL